MTGTYSGFLKLSSGAREATGADLNAAFVRACERVKAPAMFLRRASKIETRARKATLDRWGLRGGHAEKRPGRGHLRRPVGAPGRPGTVGVRIRIAEASDGPMAGSHRPQRSISGFPAEMLVTGQFGLMIGEVPPGPEGLHLQRAGVLRPGRRRKPPGVGIPAFPDADRTGTPGRALGAPARAEWALTDRHAEPTGNPPERRRRRNSGLHTSPTPKRRCWAIYRRLGLGAGRLADAGGGRSFQDGRRCRNSLRRVFRRPFFPMRHVSKMEEQAFNGGAFSQFEDLLHFLQLRLPSASRLSGDVVTRRDRPAYPAPVIREAVVNALMHRDYQDSASIKVRVFPERDGDMRTRAFAGGVSAKRGMRLPPDQSRHRAHLLSAPACRDVGHWDGTHPAGDGAGGAAPPGVEESNRRRPPDALSRSRDSPHLASGRHSGSSGDVSGGHLLLERKLRARGIAYNTRLTSQSAVPGTTCESCRNGATYDKQGVATSQLTSARTRFASVVTGLPQWNYVNTNDQNDQPT